MKYKKILLEEMIALILLISAFLVPIVGSLYYQHFVFLPSHNLTADIVAYQWGFKPNEITVHEDDIVRIRITSSDVAHGFAIDDYDINVMVSPNKYEFITFKASKTGNFIFYCSVTCGRGHYGMKGVLKVLPKSSS